jgi:hypothetical protein
MTTGGTPLLTDLRRQLLDPPTPICNPPPQPPTLSEPSPNIAIEEPNPLAFAPHPGVERRWFVIERAAAGRL